MKRILTIVVALTLFVAALDGEGQGNAQGLESPRLSALLEQVQRDTPGAVESFWKDIGRQGAPLVERVGEDRAHALVTFVWQGDSDTKNVIVTGQLGQYGGTRLVDNQMQRLANTDVWFRSYWLRRDARSIYRLAPNDSLMPTGDLEGRALQERTVNWRPDPLNPKQWTVQQDTFLPESVATVQSLLELPDAPVSPWLAPREGVPVGELQRQIWKSPLLNNERQVWLYTPPGYDATGGPYGLLVVTDGFSYISGIPSPTVLNNLIAAKRIPPVVAVFIGNAAGARTRELSCYGPFTEFLAKEIIPYVRSKYHMSPDPHRNVIAGLSLGGLTAACAGLRHPELFGNVLSQSGSFWWKPSGEFEGEWLTKQFASSAKVPLRFYLDVGLLEMGSNGGGTRRWIETSGIPYGPSMIVVNRHIRDILKAKGYDVSYSEFGGGHNAVGWRGTFADGLIALLGTRGNESASR